MHIPPGAAVPLATIEPRQFSELADAGQIELCDDDHGDPALRAGPRTLGNRILYALSYVPIIRHWQPVVAFTQKTEHNNAQVLGLFLQRLAKANATSLPAKQTERLGHAATRIVARAGATSLQRDMFNQLIDLAQTGPTLCGFSNLGNTCYANTGLKFFIHSIGKDRLVAHLQDLQQTNTDEKKRDSAAKLITLIRAAFDSDEPLHDELEALFESLQKHDVFKNFPIIGHQNDTQEFLAKLGECIDIDRLTTNTLTTQTTLINGDQKRDPKINAASYVQNLYITDDHVGSTFQSIVSNMLHSQETREVNWTGSDSENTTVAVQHQWIAPDIETLSQLNLNINPLVDTHIAQQIFRDTDFSMPVQIAAIDQKSGGKTWLLTLKPKDIIVHDSHLSHYHMYSRNQHGSWTGHDDSRVTSYAALPPCSPGSQAKMISFEVTGREPLPSESEVARRQGGAMPHTRLPYA